MKKSLITLGALVIIAAIFIALDSFHNSQKQQAAPVNENIQPSVSPEPVINIPVEIQGTWKWKQTLLHSGEKIFPKKPDAFTLTLARGGQVSGTTDCNSLNGTFAAGAGKITFGPLAMTKMFCEASQEMEFVKMIEDSGQYLINPSGNLVLGLKFDSGSVVFEKMR